MSEVDHHGVMQTERTHSLTSLHSGAREADMVVGGYGEGRRCKVRGAFILSSAALSQETLADANPKPFNTFRATIRN